MDTPTRDPAVGGAVHMKSETDGVTLTGITSKGLNSDQPFFIHDNIVEGVIESLQKHLDEQRRLGRYTRPKRSA